MIPLDEDITMLRRLVFAGDMIIDRNTFGTAVLVLEQSKFLALYGYDQESACACCDKVYKPFNDVDALVWVQTACPACYGPVCRGEVTDEVMRQVQDLMIAKAHLIKFDSLCSEYPWLIQELYAYNRCFGDWLEMYEKVRKERDTYKRITELPHTQSKQKNWFATWFSR